MDVFYDGDASNLSPKDLDKLLEELGISSTPEDTPVYDLSQDLTLINCKSAEDLIDGDKILAADDDGDEALMYVRGTYTAGIDVTVNGFFIESGDPVSAVYLVSSTVDVYK